MRVNVDDKAITDPRFLRLGARVGMDRYAALGHCLPVWSYAYANRSAFVSALDVDALAETEGFAVAMIEVNLATAIDGQLRLRGVTERLEWLLNQDAKRELAVAAKRRKREAQLAEARPMGLSQGSVPRELAGGRPSDPDQDPATEFALERDSPRAISLTANLREAKGQANLPEAQQGADYDPSDRQHVNRLTTATYERIAAARADRIIKFGRNDMPMRAHNAGMPAELGSWRRLRERILGEGADAPRAVDLVVTNLERDADASRSVEYLGELAFTEGAWMRARDGSSKQARPSGYAPPSTNFEEDQAPTDIGALLP